MTELQARMILGAAAIVPAPAGALRFHSPLLPRELEAIAWWMDHHPGESFPVALEMSALESTRIGTG